VGRRFEIPINILQLAARHRPAHDGRGLLGVERQRLTSRSSSPEGYTAACPAMTKTGGSAIVRGVSRKGTIDPARLRSLIAEHDTWYHQIDLGSGVVTPGTQQSKLGLSYLDDVGLPADCSGMKVLDVGSRDGFYAFEMERRGAEVTAMDYIGPHLSGFLIAHKVLGSSVRHLTKNVYDLDPEKQGHMDVVLFLGVLYHLRNPLLALDRVRRVVKPGGLLFVETQLVATDPARKSREPLWQFYPRAALRGDGTNKWAPNLAGLVAVLEECQFQVLATAVHGDRGYVRAQAISDPDLEYFRKIDSSAGGELV
jgi:tRNA (mo5U34)-methyltransferase